MMLKLFGIVGLMVSALLAVYAIAGWAVLFLPPNQDPPFPGGLMDDILQDTILHSGLAVVLFLVSVLMLKSAKKKRGQTNAKI